MKYTAISIGPIIKTLAMARKPRELWAASYLFSYLMKCIYTAAEDAEANSDEDNQDFEDNFTSKVNRRKIRSGNISRQNIYQK